MFDKKEALKKLNSEQYEVTQHAATEMPFSGKYNDFNQNIITGLDNKGLYDFFENYTHYLRNDEFDGVYWVNGTGDVFCKWLIQDRDNEEIDLLETTKLYYQKKIEDLVD